MSAYGFALAFFFVVLWAEEVATVTPWLAALAIIVGGSLWVTPNAALVVLGIFTLFTWPLILGWAIYLPQCWWHGVKPRAPWRPWVPLKQHEPWRRQRRPAA